jgi:hypothetical protein
MCFLPHIESRFKERYASSNWYQCLTLTIAIILFSEKLQLSVPGHHMESSGNTVYFPRDNVSTEYFLVIHVSFLSIIHAFI